MNNAATTLDAVTKTAILPLLNLLSRRLVNNKLDNHKHRSKWACLLVRPRRRRSGALSLKSRIRGGITATARPNLVRTLVRRISSTKSLVRRYGSKAATRRLGCWKLCPKAVVNRRNSSGNNRQTTVTTEPQTRGLTNPTTISRTDNKRNTLAINRCKRADTRRRKSSIPTILRFSWRFRVEFTMYEEIENVERSLVLQC
mmetsp:Transcript_2076/g.4660  ORF Transcript_2076/g.4660 Transcript_2076/m.4660 type:complete len:200 (+) Transcript_2076:111-710(+)